MKSKGSRTTPVRSAARSGEGAGENASLFAEGIALHLSDTGSRAAERDLSERRKKGTPEENDGSLSAVSRMPGR